MAQQFNPGHATSPQLRQRVSPKILLSFPKIYEAFFTKEGMMPHAADQIDYDSLSAVLASPNEKMHAELAWDFFVENGFVIQGGGNAPS